MIAWREIVFALAVALAGVEEIAEIIEAEIGDDVLGPAFAIGVAFEPPFGGKIGDPPSLSPSEIDDVIAFLATLTDGYETKR